jgi:hypothetical protein
MLRRGIPPLEVSVEDELNVGVPSGEVSVEDKLKVGMSSKYYT